MITLRELIRNISMTKEPEQQSPLKLWFGRIIDVPLKELTMEDLCRATQQDLCTDQLIPRVLKILTEEPLAGEYYDGELTAVLSTIKEEDLKDQKSTFTQIRQLINQLEPSDIDDDLRKNMLGINQVIVQLIPATEPRTSLCAGHAQQLGGESPLSNLMVAKAFAYAPSQWPALTCYANDGWVEIDNNIAENAPQTVSLSHKSFLFFGSDHDGRRGALLYSLVRAYRLNDVDPKSYLHHVLGVTADWPVNRVNELLSWRITLPAE